MTNTYQIEINYTTLGSRVPCYKNAVGECLQRIAPLTYLREAPAFLCPELSIYMSSMV